MKNASRAVSKDLDKEAFLKLLIAQLSNQDPMNPMEDREFIAQMAQFSSLEQMTNMSRTLEKMAEADKFSAVNYVGKTVDFTKEADTPDGNPKQVAAVVKAVWFDDPKQAPSWRRRRDSFCSARSRAWGPRSERSGKYRPTISCRP